MVTDKNEKNTFQSEDGQGSASALGKYARPTWHAVFEAHPELKINHKIPKRRLDEKEVTVKNAVRKIKSVDDLISYLLAVRAFMNLGGAANQARAERCLRLCLLHPEYTDLAQKLLVEMADDDMIIR